MGETDELSSLLLSLLLWPLMLRLCFVWTPPPSRDMAVQIREVATRKTSTWTSCFTRVPATAVGGRHVGTHVDAG